MNLKRIINIVVFHKWNIRAMDRTTRWEFLSTRFALNLDAPEAVMDVPPCSKRDKKRSFFLCFRCTVVFELDDASNERTNVNSDTSYPTNLKNQQKLWVIFQKMEWVIICVGPAFGAYVIRTSTYPTNLKIKHFQNVLVLLQKMLVNP